MYKWFAIVIIVFLAFIIGYYFGIHEVVDKEEMTNLLTQCEHRVTECRSEVNECKSRNIVRSTDYWSYSNTSIYTNASSSFYTNASSSFTLNNIHQVNTTAFSR